MLHNVFLVNATRILSARQAYYTEWSHRRTLSMDRRYERSSPERVTWPTLQAPRAHANETECDT